ncbi:hypothetical protein EYF80_015832 [Liparis tanakae]|uniref:Uncharacterized protein n=1 Tax=Liparis tanakae TaxID=230148 RepID=A0A4Z2I877_9TELE|nr:hypothetical protein EYF80_015832 [Liparis tanakae]
MEMDLAQTPPRGPLLLRIAEAGALRQDHCPLHLQTLQAVAVEERDTHGDAGWMDTSSCWTKGKDEGQSFH